jgi:PITH domain
MDPEENPSKIHIYVNRENLGFEDCEDVDPTQTLHLTTEDLKESAEPILLKYVKYQRVKSITLFVEDNQGGDVTALGGIKIYGRPVESTNMADFKKNPQA